MILYMHYPMDKPFLSNYLSSLLLQLGMPVIQTVSLYHYEIQVVILCL